MSAITRFFSHVMSKQSFNGRFLRQNGYELLDDPPLGEGSYAKVRTAYSTKLKLRVAVKIVDRKKAPEDFLKRFLPRELSIIQMFQHPHIIRVYEVLDVEDKVFVIMDLAPGGDLLNYIKTRGFVKESLGKKIFKQLLQAVKHCHKNGVLHRDLKCENILLDEGNNARITDFGFAKYYNKSDLCKTFCGSAAYAAYEILKGNMSFYIRLLKSNERVSNEYFPPEYLEESENQRKCLSMHLLHLLLIIATFFCMSCPTNSLTNCREF